jgi:hypothetical protein
VGVYNSERGSADAPEHVLATVLIVEEQFVSDFLRSVLTKCGYRVICTNFDHARCILCEDTESIALIITNKPLEFASTPDVPLLYVAACPDPDVIRGFLRALYLAKPFHPRDLLDCMQKLID